MTPRCARQRHPRRGPPAPSLNKSLNKCPWPRWPAAVLARCRAVAAPVAASTRRRDLRREPGRGPAAPWLEVSGVLGFSRPGCAVKCAALLPALFWLRMITKEAFRVQRFCSVRPGNLSLLYRMYQGCTRLQGGRRVDTRAGHELKYVITFCFYPGYMYPVFLLICSIEVSCS